MTKPWGDHKEHILLYYQAQNLPLIQVIGIMKELHGFIASYVSGALLYALARRDAAFSG